VPEFVLQAINFMHQKLKCIPSILKDVLGKKAWGLAAVVTYVSQPA